MLVTAKRLLIKSGSDNLKNLQPMIKQRMEALANTRIASAEEVLERLTRIARGEEKDAFGLDTNNQDKIKALELLGKNYQLYTDRVKNDTNLDINVTLDE
jgi:phage terminase small subunit